MRHFQAHSEDQTGSRKGQQSKEGLMLEIEGSWASEDGGQSILNHEEEGEQIKSERISRRRRMTRSAFKELPGEKAFPTERSNAFPVQRMKSIRVIKELELEACDVWSVQGKRGTCVTSRHPPLNLGRNLFPPRRFSYHTRVSRFNGTA
jgi:hypothetical protein